MRTSRFWSTGPSCGYGRPSTRVTLGTRSDGRIGKTLEAAAGDAHRESARAVPAPGEPGLRDPAPTGDLTAACGSTR